MLHPLPSTQRLVRLEHGTKGSIQIDGASYRRHAGLHVLQLSGGPYERGFQHGALLRQAIPNGPLPLFGRYMEVFLQHSRARPVSGAILSWLHHRVTPRIVGQYSPRLRAAIAGLADGAGLPEEEVARAYALPESMLAAISAYARTGRRPIALPPLYGCTSAVAGRSRTVRKQLLHARNFDFFGMDRWAAEPVVAFHTPEEGLRYVTVTSAGVIGGGVTAMNEKGVVCTVHQHFPRKLDFDGLSVGEPAEAVVRLAGSVDEAVEILDQSSTISAWTYVLSDRQKAVAYEIAPGARRVVPMHDDTLGYANVFLSDDLSRVESEFFTPYVRANHARLLRVRGLLAERERHDEAGMIAILADRVDRALDKPAAFGNTIASANGAASVVFRPADCRLWVSSGPAPTCYGPYIGFDLKQQGPSGKPKRFNGPLGLDEPAVVAIRAYVEGAGAAFTHNDDAQALAHVERAVSLQPESPMYRVVAGILSVKLGLAEAAEAHVREVLGAAHRPDVAARLQLVLGWSLDLQGRRKGAREAYREALALEPRDADVRHWAKAGRRRALKATAARHLPIEYVYGSVA